MITETATKPAQEVTLPTEFIESYKNFPVPWGPLGYVAYKRCVTIDTPILTKDLQWIPAGDITVGTEIIAFDENNHTGKTGHTIPRKIRIGVITHNKIELASCVEIELSNGHRLTCTPDHSWLVRRGTNNVLVWSETKDLLKYPVEEVKCFIPKYADVIQQDTSYAGGYLSAAFDGEGHTDGRDLHFVQVQNEMLDTVRAYLDQFGFKYSFTQKITPPHRKQCYSIRVSGNDQVMRFLMLFRPKRLLANYLAKNPTIAMRRKLREEAPYVVAVRDIGEKQIAVISTSTKTHITGGYPSHNTYARPIVPDYLQHIDTYHEQLKQWRKMTGDSEAHFKTEEWWQTTARCVNWYLSAAKGAVSAEEGMALYDDIMNLRCSFSGRGMWQCGTKTVERLGQNSLNNCYFVNIDSIDSFLFTFDMLMLGGGVGFNIQKEFVYELPKVKKGKVTRKETNDADFIVPDSREGWVDLLRRVLNVYFNTGTSFSFSTVCIRPAGSPIAGFGGTASGPEPLCQGISQITTILEGRSGKKLRPVDCLDILNIIGSIVVAGNVRRSAEVAIGDHEDTYFLEAKRFDLPTPIPNWRSMSNNSIACSHYTYLSDKFWKTYEVGGEPYGLVNLKLCREKGRLKDDHRKDPGVTGVNPCMPAWATILTPTGIKTLGSINIGDTIWSGKQWTKVINKWSTGIKAVAEYHTRAGVFIGTDNHRIVSNGVKIEVGSAETIDIVRGPAAARRILHDQAVIDGLVLGDGSVHKASNNLVHLYIGNDDHDYFTDVTVKSKIKRHRPGIKDTAYEVESTLTAEELPLTYERSVPDKYKFAERDVVCSFLRGLYSANGSICGNRITLKAASQAVIIDVQQMLSSVGIRSYYTINKPTEIVHHNGTYVSRQSYDLNISIDRSIFANNIGFIQNYKSKKLTELLGTCETPAKGKTSYEIVDVVHLGDFEVFDITVEAEEHTFWTGGLLVSNCAEITLESGESCNLAEIFYPNIKSEQQLLDVAARIWKVCKVVACVPHSWDLANKVISKNLRTGQGLTGVFQKNTEQVAAWADAAYRHLEKVDVAFSRELTAAYGRKINTSIKLTTVKPSGCRPVNALTTTSQGILMLDEIFENHEEGTEWSDCSNISVVRPDGTFPVSKTYVNGTTEVLGINLGYGVQLQSTTNHQWFVKQRYERNSTHRFVDVNAWCRADELKSGDVIDFALGLYTNEQNTQLRKVNMQSVRMRSDGNTIKQPEVMTPDLAWLIGYLWGDGAQSPGRWRIRFSDERRDNIDKACRIVREQFGLEGSIEQSSDRSDVSLTFASVELWHWLLGQGVWKYYADDSLNFIPKCVRTSSREVILAFFAGLFDADGCASKKNEDSRGLSLSTAYSEFSRHLQGVLLAVGIVTGRSYNKPTDTHFSDRGMYLMSISEPLSNSVSIGVVARHSNKLGKFFLDNPESVAPQKITKHFGRVESVVSLGIMPTYDFEVPEGHHYYDTAFKSHNTLSLLAGVSPGLHPEYSSFYIRRIRMASNSSIVDACRKSGYPVEPVIRFDGTRDLGTVVVEFPVKAREGSVVAKEVTAISQLEMAKMLQTNWSDNSVSVTVYYRKEELPEIKQWLSENYDTGVKTVSFLLHSEHGFVQAPYEEITEKEYERRAKNLKPLDLSGSHDEMYDTSDCAGSACPVK